MKKIIIIVSLLLLTQVNANASVLLYCDSKTFDVNRLIDYGDSTGSHLVFKDKFKLFCKSTRFKNVNITDETTTGVNIDLDTQKYIINLEGRGLGIRTSLGEGIILSCPTVRRKALGVDTFVNKNGKTKKGVTEFFGIRASAGLYVGVDAGMILNESLGQCLLTGVGVIFGPGISGVKMTVKQVEDWQ